MVAADGLRAYLRGDKVNAVEDLGTAAEEIAARLAASHTDDEKKGAPS